MSIELIVPTLGESITEATVSKWLKKVGESFEVDEPLVEIETDKITVEVPAPSAGVLSEITVQEGKDVSIGGVLGIIGDAEGIKPSKENKSSKVFVLKLLKLGLFTKLNIIDKQTDISEGISGNFLIKRGKNKLTAIFRALKDVTSAATS